MPRNPELEYITFPCTKAEKEKLIKIAAAQRRTPAAQMAYLFEKWISGSAQAGGKVTARVERGDVSLHSLKHEANKDALKEHGVHKLHRREK